MNVSYGSRESTYESALFDIDISSSCKHVFSAINSHFIHVVKSFERREESRREGIASSPHRKFFGKLTLGRSEETRLCLLTHVILPRHLNPRLLTHALAGLIQDQLRLYLLP